MTGPIARSLKTSPVAMNKARLIAPSIAALALAAFLAAPGIVRAQEPSAPGWVRFAAALPDKLNRPVIAIVLDDAGLNQRLTRRAIRIGAPLTIAFMAYADNLERQVGAARSAGHEILLHLPMEAMDLEERTGPNALLTGLPDEELARRIEWNLDRFIGYVGVNNHMGSRFTADRPAMETLMERLAGRGLLFLDSRTTARTVAEDSARAAGVPMLARDVFLDNIQTEESVRQQLAIAEDIARASGAAIAIGHPHAWTLAALEAWLPGLEERGITVVPLTAILRSRRLAQNQETIPTTTNNGANQ